MSSGGQFKLNDQFIQVAGETAYELGVESVSMTLAGRPLTCSCGVTNIYRRESGDWKIVHHHSDLTPAMIDIVSSLEQQPN